MKGWGGLQGLGVDKVYGVELASSGLEPGKEFDPRTAIFAFGNKAPSGVLVENPEVMSEGAVVVALVVSEWDGKLEL